jgi:putative membrane protein
MVMRTNGEVVRTRVLGLLAGAALMVPAAVVAQPKVDDAEIAQIVVTANAIDVRQGEQALAKATDARVKRFAQTMIADHKAVNESAGKLVAKLGVTPRASDVSRSLEASAAAKMEELSSKSGADFDRAYIANEVAYHRAVLEALDQLLIPGATNGELKQTLVDVRPAFEGHLRHAESLQSALGGK